MRDADAYERRRLATNGRWSNKVGPLGCAPSIVSKRSLLTTPPGAEKPPVLPPAASTRWQGMMIGHGFSSERGSDLARQQFVAQPLGDFAVSHRLSRRDCPRYGVDTGVELRCAFIVDRHAGEIDRFSAQQRNDTVDRSLHLRGWWRFPGARKAPQHAGARRPLICLGKLHAGNSARRPDDAARADGRLEQ